MTTSGQVAGYTLTAADLLEMAILRAGKLTSDLTAETILTALREFNTWLSGMSNRGINLWTIGTQLLPIYVGQEVINCPLGTIDVLDANYRTTSRATGSGTPDTSAGGTASFAFDGDISTVCTQSAPNGNISYDFGTAVQIKYLGWLPGATAALHLVVEYSSDGTAWTQLFDLGLTNYTDGQWVWTDFLTTATARYWRVRETSGGTISVRELFLGNSQSEIPMYRMNRNEWFSLPDKTQQGRPIQFWVNQTLTQVQMYLWLVPNTTFNLVSAMTRRQIQDLTEINQTIECPQRWVDQLGWIMAERLILAGVGDINRLEFVQPKVNESLLVVEGEERDRSPIYWQPNIAGYTR